ncbi:MAG: hypothetical protein IH995_04680 [Proteobacteria bacterium]|nr:hypothetical protein [Pseudomonadota bacterium]
MLNEVFTTHEIIYYAFWALAALTMVFALTKFRAGAGEEEPQAGCVIGLIAIAFSAGALGWDYFFIPDRSYRVLVVKTTENGTSVQFNWATSPVEYTFSSGKTIEIIRPLEADADPGDPVQVVINDSPGPAWVMEWKKLGVDSSEETVLFTIAPETAETIPLDIDEYYAAQDRTWQRSKGRDFQGVYLTWTALHTNIVVVSEVGGGIDVDYRVMAVGDSFVFADGTIVAFDIPEAAGSLLINNSPYTVSLTRIQYTDVRFSEYVGGGDTLLLELAPMSSGQYGGQNIDYLWPDEPPSSITLSAGTFGATRHWLTWDKEN